MHQHIAVVLLSFLFIVTNNAQNKSVYNLNLFETTVDNKAQHFFNDGFKTNTSKTVIPINEILDGGPGKDGIPAINNPKFINPTYIKNASKETMGVYIKGKKTSKFYPYNILVWHEIVNDEIDGIPIAITYCPLCGSAIVYERKVNDKTLQFGVSGKLWQSNMLMYDKETESFWSQIEGKAVVGEMLESKIEIYPFQLLKYKEVLNLQEEFEILSKNTGFKRDYKRVPYLNYGETEKLYYPINNPNYKFFAKELFVATTVNGEAISFHRNKLMRKKVATIKSKSGEITAKVLPNKQIIIYDEENKQYPFFVTMWFSWANHNNGIVWHK